MFDKTNYWHFIKWSIPSPILPKSVWNFIWKNSNEMKKNNKVFRNSPYHLFLCNYMSANIYLYKVTLEKSVKYVQS